MGLGSYTICEWKSVAKSNPKFQESFMALENKVLGQCNMEWSPKKFNLSSTFGLGEGEYGRTTILPGCFDDHNEVAMTTYRQFFTTAGHQMLMQGVGTGEVIPENVKIALMGFAFPNKTQHISEIKMYIGDRKYTRISLDEMLIMDTPAIIFEEGLVLDEEESFELFGYVEGPIPTQIGNFTGIYQRIVPIGAMYFQYYNKVGGFTGTAVPAT